MTAEALKVAVALCDSQRSADGKQTRKQQCRKGKGERVRESETERKREEKIKLKAKLKNVGLDNGNWH